MKFKSLLVGLMAALAALMARAMDYSVKSGETFTLTTANNNDSSYITAAGGATIVTQEGTGMIYARILNTDGGTVTIRQNASGAAQTNWQFANGIRAKANGSTVGTFVFEGPSTVKIGRATVAGNVNYPVCELAKASFTASNASLVLVDKVTVRALPTTGCKVSVQDGAILALQSTNGNLLGFFSSDAKALTLANYDVILCKQGSLPDACRINVGVGRKFAIRSCSESGWEWAANGSVTTKAFDIRLAGKGARYLLRGKGSQVTSTSCVSGRGEVVIESESGAFAGVVQGRKYQLADASKPVVLTIDDAAFVREFAKDDGWKKKVAHWFDASKADTFVKYDYPNDSGKRYEYLGEHDLIVGWKDAVKATADDIFLYNRHAMNACFPEYLPYVVKNGLNGLSYVSFGGPAGSAPIADAADYGSKAQERRWLRFNDKSASCSGSTKPTGGYATTQSPYVIMVFGSQKGGGKAILDAKKPSSGNKGDLGRASSSTSQKWTYYDAGFGMTVDGGEVVPTAGTPNGSWQIVSLDATKADAVFSGLGGCRMPNDSDGIPDDGCAGGMNYAEVLFFAEAPTTEERIACECYLAEKWGLTTGYSCVADVSPCVSLEAGDNVTVYMNAGTDYAALGGDFRGTINVAAGKTLVLDAKPLPPTEKDVPQTGLVGWYDPSFAGALTYHTASGHTDEMQYLYGRTLTDVSTMTGYKLRGSAVSGDKTRSPIVAETAKGGTMAPVRPWLDFSKDSSSSSVEGNTIRLTDATAGESGTARSIAIRQGFIALDSSLGGGNPIGDNVEFGSTSAKIRRRKGNEISAPIWSSDNTIKMTATWLDTTAVDGTTSGFSGRPEVLSFTTAENLNAGYFGDYNGNKGNYEILGEILLYSTPLSDADRVKTQEYLMYKWFGDMNGKYANLAAATISGAGAVRAANLVQLPRIGADYAGTVTLTGALTFDLGSLPATFAANLVLTDTVTVEVSADTTSKRQGEIAILTVAEGKALTVDPSLLGKTKLTLTGALANMRGKLKVSDDARSLVLSLHDRGMVIVLR